MSIHKIKHNTWVSKIQYTRASKHLINSLLSILSLWRRLHISSISGFFESIMLPNLLLRPLVSYLGIVDQVQLAVQKDVHNPYSKEV